MTTRYYVLNAGARIVCGAPNSVFVIDGLVRATRKMSAQAWIKDIFTGEIYFVSRSWLIPLTNRKLTHDDLASAVIHSSRAYLKNVENWGDAQKDAKGKLLSVYRAKGGDDRQLVV